ncbi:hypothetical protein LSM04_006015 [Trypanosoma melophagium]|uniref:uncharacterized protein n=1 Tax=Trypanosoma melophagium TaxID=715481 RepID=UPI003519EA3C|nr:hypothetical protein LSM04_006015 [Trypanosoma melophagium]
MSLQAVGWLSSKLGINIDGRNDADEKNPAFPSHFTGSGSTLDTYLHKINNAVFGRDIDAPPSSFAAAVGLDGGSSTNDSTPGNRGADNTGSGSRGGEDVELDENGLPVSKNWYYYDKELSRWNVSPEAPPHIKQEFERRLKEEEEEREGRNVIPPPPPPPPPLPPPSSSSLPSSSAATTPMASMANGTSLYNNSSLPSGAMPPQGIHPQGLFGTRGILGGSQHSPQYALPSYFNTIESSTNTLETQQPMSMQPQPHQQMQYQHPVQYSNFQQQQQQHVQQVEHVQQQQQHLYQHQHVQFPLPSPEHRNQQQPQYHQQLESHQTQGVPPPPPQLQQQQHQQHQFPTSGYPTGEQSTGSHLPQYPSFHGQQSLHPLR